MPTLPFVTRSDYEAIQREMAMTRIEEAELERARANAERDDAHEEYTAAATRELAARDIAARALNLLQEVDTTRTGGKQLQASINTLLSDAMLAGLWGEEK